jgi:hypothetical protein
MTANSLPTYKILTKTGKVKLYSTSCGYRRWETILEENVMQTEDERVKRLM